MYRAILDASQPLSSQLYKDLMADYQPEVLPLYNKSKPVEVKFGMALQQIQNVVCVLFCKYWNLSITPKKIIAYIQESLLMHPAGTTPISAYNDDINNFWLKF